MYVSGTFTGEVTVAVPVFFSSVETPERISAEAAAIPASDGNYFP